MINVFEVWQLGGEFEVIWQIFFEGLSFNIFWVYIDVEYMEFFLVDVEGFLNGNLLVLCDQGFFLFMVGINFEFCQVGFVGIVDEDFLGRQIVGNLKWLGMVGFDFFMLFVNFFQFNLGGVMFYQSDYFIEDVVIGLIQDVYVKFNFYVFFVDFEGWWFIGLIGQNLMDNVIIIMLGGCFFI